MVMPKDVGVVDTMVGFPHADMKDAYRFITRQTKDVESKEEFEFPVEYIFKDVPGKELKGSADPIGVTLREMDLWGVEMALIGVGDPSGTGADAVARFPDRFIPCSNADPNDGMAGHQAPRRGVRDLRRPGGRVSSRPAPSPRFPSTTRRCTRSTPSASSWAFPSSAARESPGRG